jgi:hypothetical protein
VRLVLLSVVALILLVPAPAALARGHLDPSFGKSGRLEVKNELHKGRNLGQVAPTVDGPISTSPKKPSSVAREAARPVAKRNGCAASSRTVGSTAPTPQATISSRGYTKK